MYRHERRLVTVLVAVRLLVLVVANIAYHTIPVYDASFTLLSPAPPQSHSVIDSAIIALLSPLARWDSIHTLAIADSGYQIEKQLAFFPLLPLTIRALSPTPSLASMLVIGWLVSLIASIVATIALYRLTLEVFQSERVAYISALWCTLSPATIHLSAIGYTESVYAMLVFSGALCLERGWRWPAAAVWSMGSLVRSNGIMQVVLLLLHDCFRWYHEHNHRKLSASRVVRLSMECVAQCVVVGAPFVLYSALTAADYCASPNLSVVPSTPDFCRSVFPNVYSSIQSRYWNIGLFHYYTAAQIPNFLLAAPALALALAAFRHALTRTVTVAAVKYQCQLLILLAICLTILHVQVSTRFLSSSPALYWELARLTTGDGNGRKWLLMYSVCFIVVGTTLFALFLPWT